MDLTAETYRDVIGRFASGVTVVTTTAGGVDLGTTVSAVTSLSLEPPMLIACLNTESATGQGILAAGRFAVSILAEGQHEIAGAFATKAPDKFAGGVALRGPSGLPLIPGALAHLECSVGETMRGGTHVVFAGAVEHAVAVDAEPLAYFRGRFGRFGT